MPTVEEQDQYRIGYFSGYLEALHDAAHGFYKGGYRSGVIGKMGRFCKGPLLEWFRTDCSATTLQHPPVLK